MSFMNHPRIKSLRQQIAALPIEGDNRSELHASVERYADQIIARPFPVGTDGDDDLAAIKRVTISDRNEERLMDWIDEWIRSRPEKTDEMQSPPVEADASIDKGVIVADLAPIPRSEDRLAKRKGVIRYPTPEETFALFDGGLIMPVPSPPRSSKENSQPQQDVPESADSFRQRDIADVFTQLGINSKDKSAPETESKVSNSHKPKETVRSSFLEERSNHLAEALILPASSKPRSAVLDSQRKGNSLTHDAAIRSTSACGCDDDAERVLPGKNGISRGDPQLDYDTLPTIIAECTDELEREICRILAKEAALIRHNSTGLSSFKKTVVTEKGETITWQFPFAVGFGQLAACYKYRQRFDVEPPEWLNRRPPCHRRKLCELAIAHGRPLPPWKRVFSLAFLGTDEHVLVAPLE